MCVPGGGKVYNAVEFAVEAAICKTIRDLKRFRKMRPLLEAHRTAIERALMNAGRGVFPMPNIAMDLLLRPVKLDEDFDDGYSKPKPKSRLRPKVIKEFNTRDVLNMAIYRHEILGETQLESVL